MTYLGGVAYRLGPLRCVRGSSGDPEPANAEALLAARGVESYACLDGDPAADALPECVERTLTTTGVPADDVDAVVLVTESYADLFAAPAGGADTEFRAGRNRFADLLDELGLRRASVFSTTYGGSCNFTQALFLARPLVERGVARRVLVVCAERHPRGVQRFMEQAVAMTGDGVATCLLADTPVGTPAFRVEHVGLTRYRPVARASGLAAAVLEMYRATKAIASDCYDAVGREPGDYAWLVFNNYNDVTTKVFAALLGFADDRAFVRNAARTGHIPSCDPLVNLADLVTAEGAAPGDALLLYGNGPISCGIVSLVSEFAPAR